MKIQQRLIESEDNNTILSQALEINIKQARYNKSAKKNVFEALGIMSL